MENLLNDKENFTLKEMSNNEIKFLLDYLKTFYIEYRDCLQINGNLTFGLELEFVSVFEETIKKHISNYKDWNLKKEIMVIKGLEVTSPILVDDMFAWKHLKEVCSTLKKYGYVNEQTGGHIHIGAHILDDNPKYWINFIKFWIAYEHIIYRFLYGERLSYRESLTEYALPIRNLLLKIIRTSNYSKLDVQNLVNLCPFYKRFALSFGHIPNHNTSIMQKGNTIEVRCPNGSLNNIIWQNNVNLLSKIFLYVISDNYNSALIEDKISKFPEKIILDDTNLLPSYSSLYLDDALEFADLIFTNNLDKMYFLRQYIKDEKLNDNRPYLSKKFTLHR